MARVQHRLMVAILVAFPAAALAHTDAGAGSARSSLQPWLVLLLVAAAIGYCRGVAALWRKAGSGRGIRSTDVARFAVGWAALAAALLPPIDSLAEGSFAVHMVQHQMLMLVAAPLLVLSRPLEALAWSMPPAMRGVMARTFSSPRVRAGWRRATAPASAWLLHAIALWVWHVPVLFLAAQRADALHVLQHACFLGSALLFWWAAFGRGGRAPDGTSLALLFTTMLHTGLLGLLLTVAPTPWYADQEPGLLDLTALEDQQLGGLVMWVPGGIVYVAASLAIVTRWLAPRRVEGTNWEGPGSRGSRSAKRAPGGHDGDGAAPAAERNG